MTPHHLPASSLLALAAAWSLDDALNDEEHGLRKLASDEADQIRAERLQAADGLRSTSYGIRRTSGGHSDPVGGLLLAADRPTRVNRWAVLAERADRRIAGIAWMLHADGPDALGQIRRAIPQIQPGTAAVVHRHLADEDRWIREAIGLTPQHEPLPGVDCPVCAHRTLYVQTAGPVDAWTVVCLAADCRLCTGQGCRCGMPGAVEGVAHIWLRAAVIAGAVAGATPTTTREDR